jgi:hypothetical protein
MSSEKRAAANRRNAKRSTGPKTATGKTKTGQNALAHGLCSAAPVIPGEPADGWDAHRAGVVEALRPVGGLEETLAERVAACLWRLRRVVAYETAVTVAGLEEAAEPSPPPEDDRFDPDPDRRRLAAMEKDLASARKAVSTWADTGKLLDELAELPDDAPVSGDAVEGVFEDVNAALPEAAEAYFEFTDPEFLARLGVPTPYADRPYYWPGWTAGLVRKAAAAVAAEFAEYGATPEGLISAAREDRREWFRKKDEKVRRLEAEVREAQERIDARRGRTVLRRAIPDANTLDKVTRYEAHLSRQMTQALHTLERLQAGRSGTPPPPPVAIDVTVDGPAPAAR